MSAGSPVGAGHGAAWWSAGWRLFKAAPGMWILVTVTFVVVVFALAMIPILGQLASTLLYPILGAGLIVGARDLDRGAPLTFGHLFACFDARVGPLVVATLLYVVGWFVVWLIAIGICVAIFGFASLSAIINVDPTLAPMDTIVTFGMATVVALLIVLVLGAPLMMAYWFAPALIALRGDPPTVALKASFDASLRNVTPLLVYGLLFMFFAIVASIPMGLGWIVLAPVFIGSIYASCRDIFPDVGRAPDEGRARLDAPADSR
ncbi:MAG: BPSS1780 family membrane protein [Casimicrobiaceae bacterium]